MSTLLSFTTADVERYKRLRALSKYLNQHMVETIPKEAMPEMGRALGILRDGKLCFDTQDMSSVLMDCCIYDWVKNGKTVVQRFAETQVPPAGTDEQYLLQAFLKATYRVLIPKDLVPGAGIQCWDALAKEDVFIMDVSFSRSSSASALPILASRTIPLGDYSMTGGAALPTSSQAMKVAMKLQHNQEIMSARVLESSKIPLAIIRASLECGMAERIRYEDIPGRFGRQPERHSFSQPREVLSRNSSCPCGSCCGS